MHHQKSIAIVILYILYYLSFSNLPKLERNYYYFHFADKETEEQEKLSHLPGATQVASTSSQAVGTEIVRGSRNLFLLRETSQWKGKDQKFVRKKGDLLMQEDPTPPQPTPRRR